MRNVHILFAQQEWKNDVLGPSLRVSTVRYCGCEPLLIGHGMLSVVTAYLLSVMGRMKSEVETTLACTRVNMRLLESHHILAPAKLYQRYIVPQTLVAQV